jgi:hypothetical protein
MDVVAPTSQPPAEAEIRAALARTVASLAFAASPRLTAFLRYVVERALAGETTRLKGYTIAVEALGRPHSFDPQIDPIVRVEAGRLRRALARFYSEGGRDERIIIELPLGCYVPAFHWRPLPASARRANAVDEGLAALRMVSLSDPAWSDDGAALQAVFELLIARRRMQVREMLTEIATMKMMLQRSRQLLRPR